jgi:eukaryotic-like serine/threonine-protein kinase
MATREAHLEPSYAPSEEDERTASLVSSQTNQILDSSLESSSRLALPPQPGTVINDKYRVKGMIGKGGMGLVVAAEHMQLGETVALKFLTRMTEDVAEFRSRFVREARVTAKLRGEHIARTLDFGLLEDGVPFMVMEYLEGTDLHKMMRATGTGLPVEQAVDFIVQACEGLAEAHCLGVVHRDLKPSNLLVTHRLDGTELIKILDFGVSKVGPTGDEQQEVLTATNVLLGSPRYMSPEQLQDSCLVDHRADIWSLAVILFELLSGTAPFSGSSTPVLCAAILGDIPPKSLRGLRPDVPEALEQAILHGLERDRNNRPQEVGIFAEELLVAIGYPKHPAIERIYAVQDRMASRSDAHAIFTTTNPSARPRPPMTPVPTTNTRSAPPTDRLEGHPDRFLPKAVLVVGLVVVFALAFGAWKVQQHPVKTQSSSSLDYANASVVAPVGSSSAAGAEVPKVPAPPPSTNASVQTSSAANTPAVPSSEPQPKGTQPKPPPTTQIRTIPPAGNRPPSNNQPPSLLEDRL